ncbi:hypothetical protein DPMN_106328 [Dreissena polymorpha]|uniref:Uncharacterized protein n=1 Tax=Dreissena polymorpha TaxID=45954 RepID=A0A9D4QIN0_DREPO|nr:hypothetical protein DPMN_106328 [Dreissena polymorpha]
MKGDISLGVDEIPYELIKHIGAATTAAMTGLCQEISIISQPSKFMPILILIGFQCKTRNFWRRSMLNSEHRGKQWKKSSTSGPSLRNTCNTNMSLSTTSSTLRKLSTVCGMIV